jgi:hypothetical protein
MWVNTIGFEMIRVVLYASKTCINITQINPKHNSLHISKTCINLTQINQKNNFLYISKTCINLTLDTLGMKIVFL